MRFPSSRQWDYEDPPKPQAWDYNPQSNPVIGTIHGPDGAVVKEVHVREQIPMGLGKPKR